MCCGDCLYALSTLVTSVYVLSPTVNHFQAPECIPKCQHLFLGLTAHF